MIRIFQFALVAWISFFLIGLNRVEATPGSAQIGIRIIYAVKTKAKSVAPELEDIKDELTELPFGKFRLLDNLKADVDLKSSVELQFPGERTISVKFLGVEKLKTKTMVSLELAVKPALKIQLRVSDGGRTLLVGPSHLEGKLILDVSANIKEK
jgi:hypothetical protein